MSGDTHLYAEDQRPCIVAKKSCGCYVAACCLDDVIFRELLHEPRTSILLNFLSNCDKYDATLEIRPASFVRAGGLNFDCKHSSEDRR